MADWEVGGDRYRVRPYVDLIDQFLSGGCSAIEFETEYLRVFTDDDAERPDKVFRVLDRLFAEVDAFVADPELRDEGDLDEEGLRAAASDARTRLAAYVA